MFLYNPANVLISVLILYTVQDGSRNPKEEAEELEQKEYSFIRIYDVL